MTETLTKGMALYLALQPHEIPDDIREKLLDALKALHEGEHVIITRAQQRAWLEDTQRLNWLQSYGAGKSWKCGPTVFGWNVRLYSTDHGYPSVRLAIDKARSEDSHGSEAAGESQRRSS